MNTVRIFVAVCVCLPHLPACIFDQPLQPLPAPVPVPEGEGQEGEGEGTSGGTGEPVPCTIEADCFTGEAEEALGAYGMCIDGLCEPLYFAEWSAGTFELALDGVIDAEVPRYEAEVYAPIRGNGEELTCLDLVLGPFDPAFVVDSPGLGNGVPADANVTGSALEVREDTSAAVRLTAPGVVGRQLVRFTIVENFDSAAVPLAIACLDVEYPAGLGLNDGSGSLADAPFLGGVLLSPISE